MKNKNITKSDIISSDIMYIFFTIIAIIAIISMTIVTIFLLACIAVGFVKIFSLNSALLKDAILLLLSVAISCIFFILAEILLIKTIINGLKKYKIIRENYINNK